MKGCMMEVKSVIFGVCVLACVVLLVAADQETINKRNADSEIVSDDLEGVNEDLDKRVFRYGRSPNVFRYGKRGTSVFRYGKRGPSVFRYGKRVDGGDDTMKRLFRWGKRSDDYMDDDTVKRVFRWGKRSDDLDDEDVKRMVFRYGKRFYDDEDDELTALKRKIFNFGKRDPADTIQNDLDIRGEAPHVPFRFGDRE